MYQSYSKKKAGELLLTTDLLISQIDQTQPLSILMAEKVSALQEWAKGRAVRV